MLAKKYHPDAAKGRDAAALFQKVSQAYQVLKDPKTRRKYDLQIKDD